MRASVVLPDGSAAGCPLARRKCACPDCWPNNRDERVKKGYHCGQHNNGCHMHCKVRVPK
jgi:hypothetical protein